MKKQIANAMLKLIKKILVYILSSFSSPVLMYITKIIKTPKTRVIICMLFITKIKKGWFDNMFTKIFWLTKSTITFLKTIEKNPKMAKEIMASGKNILCVGIKKAKTILDIPNEKIMYGIDVINMSIVKLVFSTYCVTNVLFIAISLSLTVFIISFPTILEIKKLITKTNRKTESKRESTTLPFISYRSNF